MNSRFWTAAGVAAAIVASAALAPAQAKTLKECAAQWDQMKAANQTGGMKYRDFTKQCMSGAAPAPDMHCWSGHAHRDGKDRPPSHDRPRARLWRRLEGRQGGG